LSGWLDIDRGRRIGEIHIWGCHCKLSTDYLEKEKSFEKGKPLEEE